MEGLSGLRNGKKGSYKLAGPRQHDLVQKHKDPDPLSIFKNIASRIDILIVIILLILNLSSRLRLRLRLRKVIGLSSLYLYNKRWHIKILLKCLPSEILLRNFTGPVWQLNPDSYRGNLTSSKWEGLLGVSKKLLSYCSRYMK